MATVGLLSLTTIIGAFLLSSNTHAAGDNEVIDTVSLEVPVACTLSGTGMISHNANIINGNYQANIGTTTLHAFCNDAAGFAIYAAGYTGDEIGATNSNKLVGTSASGNATIDTGLATSAGNPDVSNWAMKLAISQDSGDTTGTNAFTIDSAPNVANGSPASFSQYHTVPNEYTKVAHKDSATDMTTSTGGVKLTTTYAAYISANQPADSYSGQVIYTLVHPSTHVAPVANPATLDTGRTVNSKLKSLAATVVSGQETTITPIFDPDDDDRYDMNYAYDQFVKSISVHLETPAPSGFVPSEKNTISTSTSKKPIYAVFDNTNDAGIMHLYTEGEQIVLSPDSSFMFYFFNSLSEVSGISDWDVSNVTDMSYMFYYAGFSDTTWSIGDLSSWDTSSVTNMNGMFLFAGHSATTFTLDLSSWNTSKVTDMSYMFTGVGYSATTFTLGLSSWNTSSVTNMKAMFDNAGYSATTFTLDLSSWNTSSVTDMSYMFPYAGKSATTWSVGDLSSWNTSSVTDMSYMFNGAGYTSTTWSVGDLSSWNTSSVTNMSYMFSNAGHSATTWSIGGLSSWNTSSVTNMSYMFYYARRSATTFTLDLSSWNTSSVTNMSNMFDHAGYSATTWSVGDLSSWNTSSVTNMNSMFYYAGRSATTFTLDLSSWNTSSVTNIGNMFSSAGYFAATWSITIPQANGNGISNTTSRLYGKTSSVSTTPPYGKSFTLAQP